MDQETLDQFVPETETVAHIEVAIKRLISITKTVVERVTEAKAELESKRLTITSARRRELLDAIADDAMNLEQMAGLLEALQPRLRGATWNETYAAAEISRAALIEKLQSKFQLAQAQYDKIPSQEGISEGRVVNTDYSIDYLNAPKPEGLSDELIALADEVAEHNNGVSDLHIKHRIRAVHLEQIGSRFLSTFAGRDFLKRAMYRPDPYGQSTVLVKQADGAFAPGEQSSYR